MTTSWVVVQQLTEHSTRHAMHCSCLFSRSRCLTTCTQRHQSYSPQARDAHSEPHPRKMHTSKQKVKTRSQRVNTTRIRNRKAAALAAVGDADGKETAKLQRLRMKGWTQTRHACAGAGWPRSSHSHSLQVVLAQHTSTMSEAPAAGVSTSAQRSTAPRTADTKHTVTTC